MLIFVMLLKCFTCRRDKYSHFDFNSVDDKFNESDIANFVLSNKLPLVSTLTRDNAPEIFENPIKKQVGPILYISFFQLTELVFSFGNGYFAFPHQLLLLAVSNETKKLMPAFQEASKFFKGKVGANTSNVAVSFKLYNAHQKDDHLHIEFQSFF